MIPKHFEKFTSFVKHDDDRKKKKKYGKMRGEKKEKLKFVVSSPSFLFSFFLSFSRGASKFFKSLV